MFTLTALLSLAAYVAADETFTLTAQGSNINSPVGISGSQLVLNNSPATFVLQTPSGYLTANGQDVVLTPQGIEVSSTTRSKDFGIEDGKLRSGPSIDKFDFYSCPDGSLANFQCSGGVAISLLTGGSAAAATPAASTSAAATTTSSNSSSSTSTTATSPALVSSASSTIASPAVASSVLEQSSPAVASTITHSHSTLITVTSCSDHACTGSASSTKSNATVSTYVGGAAQVKYAMGAVALAGAMLL